MNRQNDRIFVLDDNEDLREYLKETLLSKGYTVECAGSAEETIAKIKDWPVDLFLIDLRMAGMGGIELLKKLDIKNNTYEAIIITAYAGMDSAKGAMEYGAFSYISKPITYKALSPLMKKALEMVKLKKLRVEHVKELEKKVEARTKELKEENKKLKLVENVLRESEERYRTLFKQAADSITLINAETGEVVEFNDKAHESLGYTRKEFAKLKISDFEVIENGEEVTKHIKQIIRNGSDVFETKHKTKKGEIRDILVSSRAINLGGKFFLHNIWCDITERKRIEQDLKKSKESYRELADSITDIFFAMDKKLRYTYWNKACEKLTGVSAKDAIGKTIFEIFPDNTETRKAAKEYKETLKKNQPRIFINEYFLNGRKYFFEIYAYPSQNGLSIFVKDITQRNQAEEKLRESERKLSEQNVMLQEKNIALREIMDQLESEKDRLGHQVKSNVDQLIFPLITKLRTKGSDIDKTYIDLLEENLKDLTSHFANKMSDKMLRLTQKEIEMCNMIKQGLTSKEIANLLNISYRTVETHRNNIRKKLGIGKKEVNLVTYLKSL